MEMASFHCQWLRGGAEKRMFTGILAELILLSQPVEDPRLRVGRMCFFLYVSGLSTYTEYVRSALSNAPRTLAIRSSMRRLTPTDVVRGCPTFA